MPILKEDFMRWCDKCKQTGRIIVTHEWGMGEKTDHHETCPKCLGKKLFFNQALYVVALEEKVEELEAALKFAAMNRKSDVIEYQQREDWDGMTFRQVGLW